MKYVKLCRQYFSNNKLSSYFVTQLYFQWHKTIHNREHKPFAGILFIRYNLDCTNNVRLLLLLKLTDRMNGHVAAAMRVLIGGHRHLLHVIVGGGVLATRIAPVSGARRDVHLHLIGLRRAGRIGERRVRNAVRLRCLCDAKDVAIATRIPVYGECVRVIGGDDDQGLVRLVSGCNGIRIQLRLCILDKGCCCSDAQIS